MAFEAPVARPPRWLRTLPWLAGLLIGASAHVVFFSRPAPCESVKVVEVVEVAEAAPTAVHVHVHPAAPPPAARQTSALPPFPTTAGTSTAGARGAVVCSDHHCTIRREFVRRMLAHPESVGQLPRLVPSSGQLVGAPLTIQRVTRGSIGDLLGLRNGDTLVSINGHRVDSFDDMLKLNASLRGTDEFAVALRRDSALHTLHYTLIGE